MLMRFRPVERAERRLTRKAVKGEYLVFILIIIRIIKIKRVRRKIMFENIFYHIRGLDPLSTGAKD
ncbi:MAG: hypothetical protein A4S17_11610 [Proteobacteria bacterium HN_bin10]|nr:MAG: hypothetical protein A4S17_11610 [Proteobacteria bacterium HN_bin10]